jgi:transposase
VGDADLFSSLLGLNESWEVTSVDFKPELSRVEIHVSHKGVLTCSACGEACALYDQSDERWWRHLNTMEYATFVIARIPRSNCPTHGIKQIDVPWAGPKSRFTFGMEEWAIQVLQLTKSQARTGRLLRLSAGQVHDIMYRAVKRGLDRRELDEIPHLGIDEKSFQRRDFATILCDLTGKRVLEVERGRKEESARKAFAVLPFRGMVKTVCMDMSEAYKQAASSGLGFAEIIHDRFHVAALLSQAVDETRRAEVKKRPELKESRYVWLKNPENLTDKQKTSFDLLVGAELKTAEAYAFKQVFKSFFEQESPAEAMEFFIDWYDEVQKRSLPRMKKCAHTLAANINGLLAAVKWRLTNAYAESINASIQEVKTVARGFRQFESFRIAILFFLGKLELNPRKTP